MVFVLLTRGEYSDYGVDDLIEVPDLEAYRAEILAFASENPPPGEFKYSKWEDWGKQQRAHLIAAGVAKKADWCELHRDDCEDGNAELAALVAERKAAPSPLEDRS